MSTALFRPAPTVSGSAPAGSLRLGPTAQRPPEPSMSGGDEDSTRSGSWGSPDAHACCVSSWNWAVDHALIDRRAEARLPRDVLRMPEATLRPGCPVDVIDLSPQGIQVESLRPLRPGSSVQVRLVVGDDDDGGSDGASMRGVGPGRGGWPDDRSRPPLRRDAAGVLEEQARVANLVHAPP